MSRISRLGAVLISLSTFFTAAAQTLIPTTINVGSKATTFGVSQGVIINSVIAPSVTTGSGPTGTVQFLANGSPVGPPISIVPSSYSGADVPATLPIGVPGTYNITAAYSGDSTHASAVSSYSWTVSVEQNPATIVLNLASSSLTFSSGATTGNSDLITQVPINGFRGATEMDCVVLLNPGSPTPAVPATCALLSANSPDGNPASLLSITTIAPTTVPVASQVPTRNLMLPGGVMLCTLLLFMPRLRLPSRLRLLSAGLACFVTLISLSGCSTAPSSTPVQTPTTTTVQSSAGSYTVLLEGTTSQQATGETTMFSTSIPLTVK